MSIFIAGKSFQAPYLVSGVIFMYLLAIIYVIYLIVVLKKRKFRWGRAILVLIFCLYLGVLLAVTLSPINIFPPGSAIYKMGFGRQYLGNFAISDLAHDAHFQIWGNFIMLAPFTFFMGLLRRRKAYFKRLLLLTFLASLSIESLQLVMSYFYLGNRIFDINDLILNSLGAIPGFVSYKIFLKIKKIISQIFSQEKL